MDEKVHTGSSNLNTAEDSTRQPNQDGVYFFDFWNYSIVEKLSQYFFRSNDKNPILCSERKKQSDEKECGCSYGKKSKAIQCNIARHSKEPKKKTKRNSDNGMISSKKDIESTSEKTVEYGTLAPLKERMQNLKEKMQCLGNKVYELKSKEKITGGFIEEKRETGENNLFSETERVLDQLAKHLDQAKTLVQEARRTSPVSDSVEQLAFQCDDLKKKVYNEAKDPPKIIKDFQFNVDEVSNKIDAIMEKIEVSTNIEDFIDLCAQAKSQSSGCEQLDVRQKSSKDCTLVRETSDHREATSKRKAQPITKTPNCAPAKHEKTYLDTCGNFILPTKPSEVIVANVCHHCKGKLSAEEDDVINTRALSKYDKKQKNTLSAGSSRKTSLDSKMCHSHSNHTEMSQLMYENEEKPREPCISCRELIKAIDKIQGFPCQLCEPFHTPKVSEVHIYDYDECEEDEETPGPPPQPLFETAAPKEVKFTENKGCKVVKYCRTIRQDGTVQEQSEIINLGAEDSLTTAPDGSNINDDYFQNAVDRLVKPKKKFDC